MSFEKLVKLADRFENEVKVAQEVQYGFDPNQDLLSLKSGATLKQAQQTAMAALPLSFSGKCVVKIQVNKDKSFLVKSNSAEVGKAVHQQFAPQIKELLAASGAVKNQTFWDWFTFEVS
jgi:hypothetical protein